MLRELVTRPISAVVALIELPVTMQRSLKQANDLMDASRRQLEAMQRQTEDALEQAERMNDLLGRVVKLTEPLEIAQRGSEYVGGRLKRALFGEGERIERAVEDAEAAASDAERAAEEADTAAEHAEVEAESAERAWDIGKPEEDEGWKPAGSRTESGGDGIEVRDSETIRVIPNQPPPGESEQPR